MADPGAELIRLVNDYQTSQALYVAATLRLPDLLAGGPMQDAEISYVQLSRARQETHLFCDAAEAGEGLKELAKQMGRSRQKDLAHDVLEDARHRLLHRIPRLGDILLHANPAGRAGAHDRTAHHRHPAAGT